MSSYIKLKHFINNSTAAVDIASKYNSTNKISIISIRALDFQVLNALHIIHP